MFYHTLSKMDFMTRQVLGDKAWAQATRDLEAGAFF